MKRKRLDNTLQTLLLISASISAAGALAQPSESGHGMGSGMMGGYGFGWMGGYGGVWGLILLIVVIVVVAGIGAWVVAQKKK